jgi:transcriptional regulator with XRE-family HTH domain
MTLSTEPTVRRQELGQQLRMLRKAAGFTLEDAGQVINCSASKVSRIETGHRAVTPIEVASLVAVYGADPRKREHLLALAEEAHQIGWWERNQPGYTYQKHPLITLESKAEAIISFDLAVIPGLLQTDEYMRALMHEMGVVPETQIEDRILARQQRRSVLLHRDPPNLLAIADEFALRRPVGGRDVLFRQLEHLQQESNRDNVELRVVRNGGPAHSGLDGSFLILRRKAAPPAVFIDHMTSGLFVEDYAEVEAYELAVRNLVSRALGPEQSVALVASLTKGPDMEASSGRKDPTYAR